MEDASKATKMQTIESNQITTNQIEAADRALSDLDESVLRAQLQTILRALRQGINVTFNEQDKQLTPNEAAALLQVSRPHVMALIKRGELSATIVGNRDHRIPNSEVMDLLERKTRASHDLASAFARREAAKRRIVARVADVDPDIAKELGY